MTLSMYSQTIPLTPQQEQRIRDLFTPEKIIEYSKSLSNEERQRDTILSLENKIKELKLINKSLYENTKKTLIKIDNLNTSIESMNLTYLNNLKEKSKLFKRQLTKERLKIGGIGLVVIVSLILIK